MKFAWAACLLITSVLSAADQPLFPNSGFESGTLEGWTAEGDAFVRQPTKGDNPHVRGRERAGHDGNYWIGTFENYDGREGKPGDTRGDGATGTLTSPQFTVEQPYIKFRIGGGNLPGETGVRIVSGTDDVILGTGFDSETMEEVTVDVSRFVGRQARLVVFDNATGGWGHINVDAFFGTDESAGDPRKDFRFTREIERTNYPDTYYNQPLRPQFHFSSKRGWLNDPNGMVFDGRKYHLFFQHNPKDTVWGNMTWGHATSPDMLHWTQLPHALLPYRVDGRDGTIFSGTAVVDHNNSLSVQQGDTKTLVAFYTFESKPTFYQAMAYSTDNGDTWTYWNEGRPVVDYQGFDHGERDPKVFWHEPSQQWVMVLWVSRDPGRVRWFTSKNLVDWEFASDLMRDWAFECMDVVFLNEDGDPAKSKCVIYDASFDYEVGIFDGKRFYSETQRLIGGEGDFYAAQTFNNMPDGRCVQIGWMRNGPNSANDYGLPFNQQMAFPTEMSLHSTANGPRLKLWPIQEIASLVKETHEYENVTLAEGGHMISKLEGLDLVDLEIKFEPGDATQLVLDLPGVSLTYEAEAGQLVHWIPGRDGGKDRITTLDHMHPRDGKVSFRLLLDRLSCDAYGFAGEQYRTHYIRPQLAPKTHSIRPIGGTMKINSLVLRELNSAWPR